MATRRGKGREAGREGLARPCDVAYAAKYTRPFAIMCAADRQCRSLALCREKDSEAELHEGLPRLQRRWRA